MPAIIRAVSGRRKPNAATVSVEISWPRCHDDATMNEGKLPAGVIRRAAITFAGFYLTFALAMFLPAGIRWWRGWLFLAVYLVLTILSCVYLWRANPDIFVARTQIGKGTKS